MQFLINTAILIASFLAMEGVAWFTHKYIMHGLLWSLHKDHHRKDASHFFEKNDYFFLIFAIPGIFCLLIGSINKFGVPFYIGMGITLYGFCYFLVHDIFIHQRFKMFTRSNSRYLRGIRKAHKVHHKHLDKEYGECFGMLWVPLKYFREQKRS